MTLHCTESILVARLSNGDEQAFKALFHAHKNKLFQYSLRYVRSTDIAEDIVQDTFLKIWEQRHTLNVESAFGAYLFRIARNQIFNHFKKAVHHAAYEKRSMQQSAESPNHQTEWEVFSSDYEAHLQRAVGQLPAQRQLIFQLSRKEGLSHEEIAQKLSLSKNTVKVQINKALKAIRVYLELTTDLSLALICLFIYG
jgi:RNA polymerase sigma-70 factor (family 1)